MEHEIIANWAIDLMPIQLASYEESINICIKAAAICRNEFY